MKPAPYNRAADAADQDTFFDHGRNTGTHDSPARSKHTLTRLTNKDRIDVALDDVGHHPQTLLFDQLNLSDDVRRFHSRPSIGIC